MTKSSSASGVKAMASACCPRYTEVTPCEMFLPFSTPTQPTIGFGALTPTCFDASSNAWSIGSSVFVECGA